MKPLNKCQVCGKSVQGTPLCEECEKKTFEEHKGGKTFLTFLVTIVFVGALYLSFETYKKRQSEFNPEILSSATGNLLDLAIGFAKSPYVIVPAGILMVILALLIGVKITK